MSKQIETKAPSESSVWPVMTALVMSMFVSMLSTTVVSSSLPVIITDLGGGQSALTWVVAATLLTTTVSTPVWGKLSDLFDRKLLLISALGIFVTATTVAGLSTSPAMLIAMRALQGIGAGGLVSLPQIVMADIVSPRERGRYAGLFGVSIALGTVGGPLLGGFITDALDWRWNFYVAVPFAAIALVLLQRFLKLPPRPQSSARIDYLGVLLIGGGVSTLLLWLTNGGQSFAWNSPWSFLMLGGAVVLLAVAVWWELRAPEPLLPLDLFSNRTFTLSAAASVSIGVAMFGSSVYLSQYMMMARGATPMHAGLMTSPMMIGMLTASTIVGQFVTRSGKWKRYVVSGGTLMVIGTLLLSQLHYDTPYWLVATSMACLGCGVGMTMQNLVVVTQNSVEGSKLGVATSSITFFRSLGGSIGVSVLGAVLTAVVSSQLTASAAALPASRQATLAEVVSSGTLPTISELPGWLQIIVESAYGLGVGDVFLAAVPFAAIALGCVIAIPNASLRKQNGIEQLTEELEQDAKSVAAPEEAVEGLADADLVPAAGTKAD